jgi:hypothetical protein
MLVADAPNMRKRDGDGAGNDNPSEQSLAFFAGPLLTIGSVRN